MSRLRLQSVWLCTRVTFAPAACLLLWFAGGVGTFAASTVPWFLSANEHDQRVAVMLSGAVALTVWLALRILKEFLEPRLVPVTTESGRETARRLFQPDPIDPHLPAAAETVWRQVCTKYGGRIADIALATAGRDGGNAMEIAADIEASDLQPRVAERVITVGWHEAAHAVVADHMGAAVLEVRVDHVTGSGSTTVALVGGEWSVADRMWAQLVLGVAGNVMDLRRGIHDAGSASDLRASFEDATAVISAGLRPTGYEGPFSVEAVLAAARSEAGRLIDDNAAAVAALANHLTAEAGDAVVGSTLFRRLTRVETDIVLRGVQSQHG